MRDRNFTIITLLVLLMLTVWLGFLFHRSTRFAGSLPGGVLAVSGTLLMFFPLLTYSVIKRFPMIKRRLIGWMSMQMLLTFHIYTAIIGSILVLLHTGHKFENPLGMALTALVLLVVLSGFTGRYLMRHINQGLREKKQMLQELQLGFKKMSQDFAHPSVDQPSTQAAPNKAWLWLSGWSQTEDSSSSLNAVVGGIADLEYSIAVHGWMKSLFQKWLRFHLVIAGTLFFLLALHVWSAIYYGLRWFQ